MSVLRVQDVSLSFSGIQALSNVSLEVEEGVIYGLIGPNGAGKTSLFNCISGLYRPTNGRIYLDDQDITTLPPNRIARKGIARTFQNLVLYNPLSVLENVKLGSHIHFRQNPALIGFLPASLRKQERLFERTSHEILDRLGLNDVIDKSVSDLPYATLKRVELARAICMRPKILLLDEPAGGISRAEVNELSDMIKKIRDEFGITILLVEHHMGMVMEICEKITVLNFGEKIAEGRAENVKTDEKVIEAYLGKRNA